MTPQRRTRQGRPPSPLRSLSDHLARLARTADGRRLVAQMNDAGLDLGGAQDLAAWVVSGVRQPRTVEWLVRQVRGDELVVLTLLVAFRPEIEVVALRLERDGRLEREEAEAVALAGACEVIGTRAHQLCAAPINAIWLVARQMSGMRRRCPVEFVPLLPDFDAPELDSDPSERWPGILAGAAAAGILTPRQVVIVALSRMEERPLTEIAVTLGRPYDAVRKERKRAEKALRSFALRYSSGSW